MLRTLLQSSLPPFRLPPCVIHCFTGTRDQAQKYLELGCYIGLTGYLWKDKSENGVRKILEDGVIPLDKLLVETDAPFMYPNTRASKLPQHIKDCLTERSVTFLQRYCTFQVRRHTNYISRYLPNFKGILLGKVLVFQ